MKSATSHQPPATSHQPPATSHQPPAQPNYLKRLLTIILLVLLFSMVSVVVVRAFDVQVGATIKPHYSLQQAGNILYLNTNMTVYLNGKRVLY